MKQHNYPSIMNGNGQVQGMLRRYADSASGGATAKTNAHGHEGEHFAVEKIKGRFANGYLVHPTTNEGSAHAREALDPYADKWK